MNIGKVGQIRRSESNAIEPARLESAFDDLDEWDDVPADERVVEPLPEPEPEFSGVGEVEPAPVPDVPEPPPAEPPQPAATGMPVDSDKDEFSPPVRPAAGTVPPRPRMKLSGIERVGLVVLAIGLMACGVVIYGFSIYRLPTRSPHAQDVKFPVQGAIITVKDATSYWRAPVVDGPNPEIVRRGTIYLPVVEVTTSAGTGAIRAVFRDHDRKSVGDMVTLPATEGGVLRLAGTAGFEESGTHAAYRAGGHKPWTVEILEAPSIDSPSSSFKRLFLMNLSTETR